MARRPRRTCASYAQKYHSAPAGTMAHCPAVTTPFGNLANALIQNLQLSDHRRELVIVRTATLARSPFEMTQHLPVVRQLKGWSDASVTEVNV